MSKLEKVIEIVARETGTPADSLNAATRLHSLGMDSLDFISLLRSIESEFDCTIADADYPNLQTIGDIAERV